MALRRARNNDDECTCPCQPDAKLLLSDVAPGPEVHCKQDTVLIKSVFANVCLAKALFMSAGVRPCSPATKIKLKRNSIICGQNCDFYQRTLLTVLHGFIEINFIHPCKTVSILAFFCLIVGYGAAPRMKTVRYLLVIKTRGNFGSTLKQAKLSFALFPQIPRFHPKIQTISQIGEMRLS